ncbi:hypothetical protein GCM10010917_24680 [Paenibacillus physcomitrellae]|uniref:Uncharacterized protein n=1 Tax=Paenibacillus physcomitrellae TaxID=1619311 RepID=A0ABQ1G7V6_9BACL|nr:hypothetical protein GCM10010917_24680 [Paenibacillus physcomitrellae]
MDKEMILTKRVSSVIFTLVIKSLKANKRLSVKEQVGGLCEAIYIEGLLLKYKRERKCRNDRYYFSTYTGRTSHGNRGIHKERGHSNPCVPR